VTRRADRRSADRRVLHVTHYCLPHIGGLETVVAAETRGLAARGWGVSLLSSDWGIGPGVRDEGEVRTVRVRAWHQLEPRFGVPFPVFSPWLVVALWREVRRADVVHVHDPLYLTSWVAALWCRVLGTPYVVHRHVGFVHHSSLVVRLVQRVVLGSLARLVLGGAAAILPIDEFIAAGTRSSVRAPERVRVLGNGVDTSRFRPPAPGERERLRRELGLPLDESLLLFVGRFVPKKGFAMVAAAASDGYRVVYRAVDAFVVASVGECPLTVLEAMSSSLPVLLNDDPALHSPWTAGPGVRFVDMAAGDLRHAIQGLVSDRDAMVAIGARGHRHVQEAFSWEAHLDRLETIYRRLRD
jgi:glycosyltransferase involved in cell wall biosynthesis